MARKRSAWFILVMLVPLATLSREPRVDHGDGADVASILEVPTDYASIQEAVDAASDGDTIRVLEGDYAESVLITAKELTLIGVGAPSVTALDWNGTCGTLDGMDILGTLSILVTQHTFAVANTAVGGGFTITTSASPNQPPLVIEDSHFESTVQVRFEDYLSVVILRRSTFEADVHVSSENGFDIRENVFLNASLYVAGEVGDVCGNTVVDGSLDVDAELLSTTISDNQITGTSRTLPGIVGHTAWAALYIRDNTITGCDRGIEIDCIDTSWPTVAENRVSDCRVGISIDTSTLLRNNVVWMCDDGIAGDTSWGEVVGNTVVACGRGMVLDVRDEHPAIENNIVAFGMAGITVPPDFPPENVACNDVWSNAGGNWFGIANPTGINGNLAADPIFCDLSMGALRLDDASPCAPGQHPDGAACGLIGAEPVGCPESVADGVPGTRSWAIPNPASDRVEIHFPRGVVREAIVYDARGRRIRGTRNLLARTEWIWTLDTDGGDRVPSGVYFYELRGDGGLGSGRVLVIDR